MKTIIARFEDMKKDPMAILEDGVSANKVETALASIGIALRNSEGEFRELQDVFDELGMKWQSLTRNQQAYIATVAAGSRQQSRFLALMNNYDRTLDLIAESQNSAGAAAQQYATYQDSIAAAQARLTASWEKLYSKIVDNDIIKFAINGLTELLELLSHIPPSITAIGATIGALQLQQFLNDNGGLTKILTNLLGGGEKTGKQIALSFINKFTDTSYDELKKKSPTIIGGFKTLGKNSVQALTSMASGLFGVVKAIGAFVSANAGILGIAALVTGAIALITYKLTEQKRKYEENIKTIKEYNESANELSTRSIQGEELFKKYDELSSKISLTEEEQNELNSTIKQISEIYPETITYLDEYGNMQMINAEQIRDTIEAERQLAQERKKQALEKKGEILEKSEDQWTKESFDEVGINNKLSTAYFDNKDEITRLKNLKEEAKILSTFKDFKFDPGFISDREKFINQLNSYNKKFSLNLGYLAKDATDEMIEEYGKAIGEANFDTIISSLEEKQELIKKQLLKENNLELSFANLGFSENSEIATSQRVIASQMQSMLSKMNIDIWEDFFENNGGSPEAFAEKMQEIIDVVSKENGIELKQLFKDFDSGEISASEFFDKFLEIANQSGNSAAINFANGFSMQLGEQLDKEKEKYKNYLISLGLGEDYATLQSEKITKIGQGQKRQDYIEEYLNKDNPFQLTSFSKISTEALQDLEVQVAEAIKDGNLDGLESLPDVWAEKWGIMDNVAADIISYGATADAIEKMIEEKANIAFENIGKTASQIFSKKDFSSVGVDEAVDYMGVFGGADNFLKHAKMGDDGKFEIDVYGQRLMLQKQLNDQIAIYDGYISDIEKLGENITPEEKKQLEYWKKLREETAKQGKKISDIFDITKEIEGSAKDIKRVISEIEIPDGLGGIATENARALSTSIDIGKEYENIIGLAEKLEKQMKEVGQVDDDVVQELLSYGSAFTDFFVVDEADNSIKMALDGVVNDYAGAAQAIVDIANKRRLAELEIKKQEMLDEAEVAEQKAAAYDNMARLLENYVAIVIDNDQEMGKEEVQRAKDSITHQIEEQSTKLENIESSYEGIQLAAQAMYDNLEMYDVEYWKNLGPENIAGKMQEAYAQSKAIVASANLKPLQLLETGDKNEILKAAKTYKQAAEGLREYAQRLRDGAEKLKIIDPTVYEEMADKLEQAGNAGTEAGNAIANAIAKAADAIVKLNELVDNLKESLKDVTIDIDPFTELFEEWEHEWDYFFNIKNFIGNKQRSRNLFSRVADAEWASPEDRLAMDDAIMGSYIGEFAARREYAEGLMADIVQKGTDMTEKYGQFGTFDPETMTWYQKDDELVKINEEQAQRVENINNLQRQQWEKNNELAAEEANLELLESKKDAYEDALSTINDTIESLKEKEGIEADTSALEDEKKKLEDNLKATEDGIEAQKDSIEDLKEEIKKIDFDLWAEQDAYDFWDNFVNGMDDDISSLQAEIEEYFGNIDAMYEDIEGAWAQYTKYLEATMNTQQQLFDAIVENYQKEIDAKKKEYDELKRLDNEYLQSVKDNIAKEREAREDSKKQKSYQQSLQRAQLLQMDTSGAFRTELNELKNSIEQQREDLYDDLVDKQVEALEKEIEKRHELYDKEVAALEERLAYMQENASLLWEMVNEIVAQGSGAMMSILEGTAEYMNSSELQREQLRNQWQYNTLASIKFTTDQWGKNQELMIKAMGEIAETAYPNYKKEVEDNTEVLKKLNQSIEDYKNSIIQGKVDVDDAMSSLVSSLSTEFTNYMNGWAVATSTLTGNVTVYGTAVNDMINSLSTNIQTLDGWNSGLSTSGGKIIKTIETYDEELAKKYAEIYKDYEDERNKYQGELDSLIQEIQEEISSAIEDAAEAIRKAVDSLTAGSGSGNGEGSGGGGGGSNTPTNPEPNPGGGNEDEKRYRLRVWDQQGNALFSSYGTKAEVESWYQKAVSNPDLINAVPGINLIYKLWRGSEIISFLKGGLANFTGPAWLDGTASSPERVLSPHQTKLFESMVSSLERASNNSNINSALGSSYNIGDINTSIQVAKLDNQTDINQLAKQVEDKIVKTIRNRVTISV